MRRPIVLYATIFVLMLSVTSGEKPVTSNPNLELLRQLNTSSLTPPPAFKVDIDRDTNVPLISEAIYRTAINMMYDISTFSLTHRWLARDWFAGAGDLGIHIQHNDFGGKDPSRLLSQYVIWGLNHMMLSMYLSKQYCQTVAVLKWREVVVGVVFVSRTESLDSIPASDSPASDSQNLTSPDVVRVARHQSRTATNENIEVSVRYLTSVPIDRHIIYLTGIKAMGEAAEIGLDIIIQGVFTQGLRQVHWQLGAGIPGLTGAMKPSYSRIAVMKTLAAMIEDSKFQEIGVVVEVNGKVTAVGGFGRGVTR